jgi:hypothetical protein
MDPFPVDGMAFPPQQNVQATVAEMPSLLGEGFQPLAQRLVARSSPPVVPRASPPFPERSFTATSTFPYTLIA